MLAREGFQFRATGHAAVGVEDLHQHAGRFQPGHQREVAGRFGMAGAIEHAAGLRRQRKDVPRLGQIPRLGIGAHGGAHGMRAVVGGNAGGDAFGRLDADGEVGMVRRGVVLDHRRQAQLPAALAGQRQADQAARVGDHEVDVGRLDQFGRHDQIALVFAILVVDDDDHAAVADFFQQFGDGGETHACASTSRAPSRRST